MLQHVVIRLAGKVQGVFFRASTQEKAMALGITGFVRNEDDGGLYIEAEGTPEALREFIAWTKQGPSRAKITAHEVTPGVLRNFEEFTIEY